MCGICGFFAQPGTDQKKLKGILKNLLVASESRGKDATGWAMTTNRNSIVYCKAPVEASQFIEQDTFKKFKPNDLLIGHTRQGTQGSPKENANNHPIVTKSGLAMVHNGLIYNDKEIKDKFRLQTDGEVDSEVLLRLVEKFRAKETTGKAIKEALKELRGAAAAGFIDVHHPDTLYLVRSSNPLSLAYHETLNTIFFASTSSILERSLFQTKKVLEFFMSYTYEDGIVINEVEDDTLVVIQRKNGSFKISTQKVEMKRYVFPVGEYTIGEQTSFFGREEDSRCPHCKLLFPDHASLNKHIAQYHPGEATERQRCPYCGAIYSTYDELYDHIVKDHPEVPGEEYP